MSFQREWDLKSGLLAPGLGFFLLPITGAHRAVDRLLACTQQAGCSCSCTDRDDDVQSPEPGVWCHTEAFFFFSNMNYRPLGLLCLLLQQLYIKQINTA